MAVARRTEPWSALLDAGRADGRLVREAFEGAREPAFAELPARPAPDARAGRWPTRGSSALRPPGAGAARRAGRPRRSSRPAPRRGKSLCFNLPTLEVAAAPTRKARALYLYPTKALAQDQARALHALRAAPSRCARRSTTATRRARSARRSAGASNLVLTNPDMLHVGILPQPRARGATSSPTSRVVVVDEAHVYRGVFGSHVANVLRRLRRIAARLRHDAALPARQRDDRQPGRARRAAHRPRRRRAVDEDGSPGARRQIAMWNPPLDDEALQTRAQRARARRPTCRRARARGRADDLLHEVAQGRRAGRASSSPTSSSDAATRARRARRALPRRLHARSSAASSRRGSTSGELLAVVTTDALELGIDIGALDAAVCVTFPGTVASLRQMWGRAGRRGRGLAVYVAGEDALDQFFCRHPDEFLERPVEAAILDHENEQIHLPHLLCAAHEGPLDPRDRRRDPRPARARALRGARRAGRRCVERRGRFTLRAPEDYPAARVSLRSASPRQRRGRRRRARASCSAPSSRRARARPSTTAPSTCTRAASTRCASSTSTRRRALVEPFDGDWYTQPKRETDTEIERLLDRREALRRDAELRRRSPSPSRCSPTSASGSPTTRCSTSIGARPAAARVHHAGALVRARPTIVARRLPARGAARRAARDRARADRGAAAAGDVRPLGHRRPVDERPPADRRARRSSSTTATPAASASRARASARFEELVARRAPR